MRAAALAVTVGASLTVVATTPVEMAAAAKKPPRPVITKVAPKSGPTTGGTVVTIKGKHLKTASKVLFGRAKGTKLKVKSDRKLTVVAPPHDQGVVAIKVKTRGGKSAKVNAARFTYLLQKPQITVISPSSGPDTGGTVVTVTGTGFVGVSAVAFDGTPGSAVQVLSPTQLRVTSPEHPAGQVRLTVSNAAGTSPPKNETFRFLPVPRAAAAPMPPDADPDPGADLSAVSCPAEQTCFAGGSYLAGGLRKPLVERRTGPTTWVATSPALPGDADVTVDVDLLDLDCGSATSCVAVGTYLDDSQPTQLLRPLVETWNGATWTASSPTLPAGADFTEDVLLSDVDCASATACVAVGRYEDTSGDDVGLVLTLAGSTWSSQAVPAATAGSTAQLFAVDCPVAASCVAVGEERTAANVSRPIVATGPSWSVVSPALPADAHATDPEVELRAVSCISAGSCAAAGSYRTDSSGTLGFLEVQAPGWTPVATPAPDDDAASNPELHFHGVSCSITCAAVGDYQVPGNGLRPVLVNFSGTNKSVYQGAVPGDATGSPSGSSTTVTCAGNQHCVGVGFYDVDPALRAPLLSNLTGTGWAASAGPRPAGLDNVLRPAASSLDGTVVAAVGYFVDGSGYTQALLMVDLPI
jgi:hypothetical protein